MNIEKNLSIKRSKNLKKLGCKYLGRKNIASCGLEMEIIGWINARDITIRFEDGTIKEHVGAQAFSKGSIKHPLIKQKKAFCFKNVYSCEDQKKGKDKMYHVTDPEGNQMILSYKDMYKYAQRHGYSYPEQKKNWEYFVKVSRCMSIDKTGERRRMNNGMFAEVIRYKNSKDCDIRFDDGYIAKKKYYRDFVIGAIRNPNIYVDSLIGEKNIMKNTQTARIIAVRNSDDCDIEFEDGTIVKNIKVNVFQEGSVRNPNFKACAAGKIGERKTQIYNRVAEIIRYNSATDIDVRFDSGEIVYNQKYKAFKSGKIIDPTLNVRVGESRVMKDGSTAVIERITRNMNLCLSFDSGSYNPRNSYSIRDFLEGDVTDPQRKKDFSKGEMFFKSIQKYGKISGYDEKGETIICTESEQPEFDVSREKPTNAKKPAKKKTFEVSRKEYKKGRKTNAEIIDPATRLGETKMIADGVILKITKYTSTFDIDVLLLPHNYELKHKTYAWFKRAGEKTIELNRLLRLQEQKRMNNGQLATIIGVEKHKFKSGRERLSYVIEFEDGTVVRGKEYRAFVNGKIGNPSISKGYLYNKDLIGETQMMNNGQIAKIINVQSKSSIDIEFEDGTVVKNRPYSYFTRGKISNPNYKYNKKHQETKLKRIGETIDLKCGFKATIIDYTDSCHMTVQLENGEIFHNVSYSRFCQRNLKPTKNYVGLKSIASNGQEMEIISDDKGLQDLTIRFEDGTIVEHKRMSLFKEGTIENPNLSYRMVKKRENIGQEYMLNCGIRVRLIDIDSKGDYIPEAEDGTILRADKISRFKLGLLAHNKLSIGQTKASDRIFCGFKVLYKEPYTTNESTAFYKVLTPEGDVKIMTPQMMMAYARLRGDILPDWSLKYCEKEMQRIKTVQTVFSHDIEAFSR